MNISMVNHRGSCARMISVEILFFKNGFYEIMLINHLHRTESGIMQHQLLRRGEDRSTLVFLQLLRRNIHQHIHTHLHSRLDLYVLPTHQAGAWEKEGCVVASLVSNYTPATLRYISSDVEVSVHARDSILLVCNDVRQVKTVHLVACWAKLLQEYFTACLLLSKLQQDALLQFFML